MLSAESMTYVLRVFLTHSASLMHPASYHPLPALSCMLDRKGGLGAPTAGLKRIIQFPLHTI